MFSLFRFPRIMFRNIFIVDDIPTWPTYIYIFIHIYMCMLPYIYIYIYLYFFVY